MGSDHSSNNSLVETQFQSHPHWPEVKVCIEKLQSSGFKTYIVGGAVRDALLGIKPKDIDLVTDATPDQVQNLFPKSIDIGKAFGIIMLPAGAEKIEIATFRKDYEYKDGRRPTKIEFSSEKEDALRRDFTINALFYDFKSKKIIDYVDGLKDLAEQKINCVGDAKKRFAEDHLRILRALRFSAQLGFTIEEKTYAEILINYKLCIKTSKERITDEMRKMTLAKNTAAGFQQLIETGLFVLFFPEHTFVHDKAYQDILISGLQRMQSMGRLSFILSWMNWIQLKFQLKTAPQDSDKIRHEDNDNLQNEIQWEFTEKTFPHFLLSKEIKQEMNFLYEGMLSIASGTREAFLLLDDALGPLLTELSFIASDNNLFQRAEIQKTVDLYLRSINTSGALPKPWLDGEDLIHMGFIPSPRLGTVLKDLYLRQLNREFHSPLEAKIWVNEQVKKM
jgi:poly(A) polymerase